MPFVLGKLAVLQESWLRIKRLPLKTYSSYKLVEIYLYRISGVLTLNPLGVLIKANTPYEGCLYTTLVEKVLDYLPDLSRTSAVILPELWSYCHTEIRKRERFFFLCS